MLTKNDLSAIQRLVREEVRGAREDFGKKIDGVHGRIQSVEEDLRNEIKGVEKRLNSKIAKVQETLDTKIAKVQESVDIIQEVVVKHYGKLDQRVTKIEELQASRN